MKIIAPWREWDFKSRTDLIEFAQKHGIPVPATKDKPYSTDRNLLHISFEGGILEDPWIGAARGHVRAERLAGEGAGQADLRRNRLRKRRPRGRRRETAMSPAALLAHLNRLGGQNGIGRVDMVENRYVGMKSRGVYETPGGTILQAAHRAMESITLDREVMHLRDSLDSAIRRAGLLRVLVFPGT